MSSKYTFDKSKAVSWSYLSSFEYNPEEWFDRYILKKEQKPNAEMEFGKKFADSCEARKPLAPVTMLSKMEQPFKTLFGDVVLVGYADTFDHINKNKIIEFKTGVKPWDQKRVDEHWQITMYALMNYLVNRVKPEDCEFALEWIPTIRKETGDFKVKIDFKRPIKVHHFKTKRTMKDIMKFGAYINDTLKRMEEFVNNHA